MREIVREEFAPAKINLFLHVGPLSVDGYHPICSLMTFADIGDTVRAETGAGAVFEVDGPFGAGLGGDDNLVVRARDAAARTLGGLSDLGLRLTKRLPVASGIGGGSADAAAVLRLLPGLVGGGPTEAELAEIALGLGADVPACLASRPCLARGRGEHLSPPPPFPALDAVLFNPGVAVSTGAVFRAFDAGPPPGEIEPAGSPASGAFGDVIAWLARQRNDLEAPAASLAPEIPRSLDALRRAPETVLARLSGSGATCFALCGTPEAAVSLAGRLAAEHPGAWVRACRLAGAP